MKQIVMFDCDDKTLEKDKLGNKGANLINLYRHNVLVPMGFVISSDMCKEFLINKQNKLSIDQKKAIYDMLVFMSDITGKKINDKDNPLIVSVRSGASVSMPGILSTILNVGITQEILYHKNEKYLFEAYLLFMNSIASSIYNVDLSEIRPEGGNYREVINSKKECFYNCTNTYFEDDILKNIENAIIAVFLSWNSNKAIQYRKVKGISNDIYTAVVIQEMRFGNYDKETSGSGVLFTINPITRQKEIYGEYITDGQGEEVVSGIRNTHPISDLQKYNPDIYNKLVYQVKIIENIYEKPQDIEFTFENNELYILQTRDVRI